MDYFRPPFAINSRPPLFHPRMEHFHFMPPGPGPFHPASPAHFAMATPSGIGLYLQRPPLPPPPHLPMYGAGPYSLHNHSHNLQHGDHQHPPKDHRRQRPSRRVRQRTKRQPEKAEKSEEDCREDDIELIPMATESGYDTTGDCHTPVTPLSSPLTADGETKFSTATKELSTITDEDPVAGLHSRSDSASSTTLSEASLKRLLKDLHRCDVSIGKYQAMLKKNHEAGMKDLQEMFNSLRNCLNEREQDLVQKLTSVKETASSLLKRRKSTAAFLRQMADGDLGSLEEGQILELKHQMKCFVTDRKVDEEIGTTTYFQADLDDLARNIMGFGKVNEARHMYTVWEENPEEIINISKKQVLFAPINGHGETGATKESDGKSQPAESDSDSITAEQQCSTNNALSESSLPAPSSPPVFEEIKSSSEPSSNVPAPPESPKSSPSSPSTTPSPETVSPPSSTQSSPAKSSSSSNRQHLSTTGNRQMYSYRVSATSSVKYSPKTFSSIKSGRPWHAVAKVPAKRVPMYAKHKEISAPPKVVVAVKTKMADKEKTEQPKKELEDHESDSPQMKKEEGKKEQKIIANQSKYSSSELQTIQSRIKESLRQQGVYLYDPVTGDGPVPTEAAPGGRCSSSSVDITTEKASTNEQNTAPRKKKTPTQLRRERKKRQKERERRQRELERKSETLHLKQSSDVKMCQDSGTETKKTKREKEQTTLEPAGPAIDTALGEWSRCNLDTEDRQGTPDGELSSSSDYDPQPAESSSNNSQSQSPVHSASSSMDKSRDRDNQTREEDLEVEEGVEAHSRSSSSSGGGGLRVAETTLEEEEEEGEERDQGEAISEITSTAGKCTPQDDSTELDSPNMVVPGHEVTTSEACTTDLGAGHLATEASNESDFTTCEEDDFKSDDGMKNRITEVELELKPEE